MWFPGDVGPATGRLLTVLGFESLTLSGQPSENTWLLGSAAYFENRVAMFLYGLSGDEQKVYCQLAYAVMSADGDMAEKELATTPLCVW